MKTLEVPQVFTVHAFNQGFGCNALSFSAQHDGRAVGIVSANVMALVPLHFLEAHPDIGLNVFHKVPEVNGTIGVGQGGSDENFARHEAGLGLKYQIVTKRGPKQYSWRV
jgi:hypothetical protein